MVERFLVLPGVRASPPTPLLTQPTDLFQPSERDPIPSSLVVAPLKYLDQYQADLYGCNFYRDEGPRQVSERTGPLW